MSGSYERVPCPACGGVGNVLISEDAVKCSFCHGSGEVNGEISSLWWNRLGSTLKTAQLRCTENKRQLLIAQALHTAYAENSR